MLLLGVMGLGWALTTATSSETVRPAVIESLSPAPDSQSPRQTSIQVDVLVDYRVEIWIDFRGSGDLDANWVRVPESEITVIEATGHMPGVPHRMAPCSPSGNRACNGFESSGIPRSGSPIPAPTSSRSEFSNRR